MCNLSHHLCPKSISIFLLHSEKIEIGAKYMSYSITVSHVKQEEDISPAGQIVSPMAGKCYI